MVFLSPPDLGHVVWLPDLSLEVRMARRLFCTVSLPRMCRDSSPRQGASSFPCLCFAEVMKASQQAIERGVKDCLFVDYKRRSGHFDVTTVASIKEITEKVPVASDQGLGCERLGLDALCLWISALCVSWAFSELVSCLCPFSPSRPPQGLPPLLLCHQQDASPCIHVTSVPLRGSDERFEL